MKNNWAINRGIQGILFVYPVLLLTVKGGMSASLILLAALSIYLLFNTEKKGIRQDMDSDIILFGIAMGITFISILLSQLYHMDIRARYFDSSLRFLFSIPIFVVLRNVDYRVIGKLQYSLPAGAILIGAIIYVMKDIYIERYYFANRIHLGDLALMLGFLSVFSINWTQKDSLLLVGLKVLGLAAGLYVSLFSGTRGGWVAIPLFVLVWVLFSSKFKSSTATSLGMSSLAILLVASICYFTVETVHIRVDAAISDLTSTNPDTSLGVRFQLWRAATQLFMQNPIFGVGADGFGLAMDRISDAGIITKVAAEIGKGEVHSYYFACLARFGVFGLLSILLLFCIPLWLFYKATKSHQNFHRVAARMGLILVLGFIVFCLTVEMFNLKMIATFYGVTLAVLLAAATNRSVEKSAG